MRYLAVSLKFSNNSTALAFSCLVRLKISRTCQFKLESDVARDVELYLWVRPWGCIDSLFHFLGMSQHTHRQVQGSVLKMFQFNIVARSVLVLRVSLGCDPG